MPSTPHPVLAAALGPVAPPPWRAGFYLVESRWKRQTFIHETDLAQADLDTVVRMIAEGQYDTGDVTAIYRCDPDSRIMEDETQAVLERVARHLDRAGTPPCEPVARLLWQNGIAFRDDAAE
ncbi:hypothetical protein [Microvirga sesbaniae]|uniref:hypothetical protein n=1 Tax=Microvirga sesbaniae TaxID=681392 RepID=UPI0021C7555F|nr:hypothetical protein [Microvirga sp. HBU67692]